MKRHNLKSVWAAVFLMGIVLGTAFAQRLTGKLTGVVTDEQGTPLPGVVIEITGPALMGGQSLMTTDRGGYRFINLPPGEYTITYRLAGFEAIEKKNIRISINSTVTDDVVLMPMALRETVTVTGEAPIMDVDSSKTSAVYSLKQMENLPSGRLSFFDIIKQNPGFTTQTGDISSSARISAFGSNSEENSQYIDGVEVSSPELGTPWLTPTMEMFEEVEVTGIGASAEYGNFTGSYINIVTKSGGNRFSGSAGYYGQFDALTGDNNPLPYNDETGEGYHSFHRDEFYDAVFTLGGPIIKDKIWFFGFYQGKNDSSSLWQADPDYPARFQGNEQFIKFTLQPASKHRLVLSFDRQFSFWPAEHGVDAWNMPESVGAQTVPTYSWNAHYTFFTSENTFFDLKYSGYYSTSDYMPAFGGDINDPAHYDLATGVTSQGLLFGWEYKTSLHKLNATMSHFAEDFLAGDHDFRFGAQIGRGTVETWGGYGGGKLYWDYNNAPYHLYEQNIFSYGGTVQSVGAFADDSWKIGNRLVVNLGLRFDYHNGYIPAFPIMDGWVPTDLKGPALEDLVDWRVFSPRVGLTYQLTPDQRTLLRAAYGRYFNYPYTANWDWPGPNVTDFIASSWNGTGWDVMYTIPGEMGYRVDENLRNPFADQISVAIERELFADFSIGVTYLYKIQKNTIGYVNAAGVYEEVQRISPDNGKTYTVFNQINAPEVDHLLTNPEGWGQDYQGLLFSLTKRYSRRWLLNASLTLSKAEGLNLSSGSTGGWGFALVWITKKFGTDPNDLINAKGALNFDRRWSLKVSGVYEFPLGILASANIICQQGRPRIHFVRVYELDQMPGSYYAIIAEPKGTERYSDQLMVDFRVQKSFELGKTFQLQLFADIFNLFNDDTYYAYRDYNLWAEYYDVPSEMARPRRIQVGAKFQF
jgi:outer membrane receptor protein involved in Fe transport